MTRVIIAIEPSITMIAERICRDGRRAHVSHDDLMQLASAWLEMRQVVETINGLGLPAPAARPPCSASLAAALAAAIRAFDRHIELQMDWAEENGLNRMEAVLTFEKAFTDVKTLFEKEFPHGEN